MDYELVIKNGIINTATATYQADVAINQGKIEVIGNSLEGKREINADGKYVIPGAVDIHVHMQLELPGDLVSSDTFFTGTRAAAFGGTTAIVDFVEAKPDETLVHALSKRREIADPQVVIDYSLHMTIGPDDIKKFEQVEEAYQAGCATFKLYMAYGLRLNDGQLFKALEAVGKAGGLSVVHAENWDIITTLIERNINAGHLSPDWHPRCRPAVLEGEAAGRVIDIADYLGVAVHIFHVSCKDSMLKIQAARQRGLPVTGETCPQYLFLTINAFDAPGVQGALPVCAPPIRTKMDQQALWQALREDDLQIVTTDHCPFTFAQKQHGFEQNFSKIPGGVPSIEMRLSAIYSSGVVSGQISLNRWVDICCTTPAKLAGFKNKGDIAIGYDADLVIFDPEKQVTLSADFLHENVEWTPYEGQKVKGWPVTTISRGNVVVENGEFKGEQGMGKFIARSF